MALSAEPQAWGRACGAARSLYAARFRIVRARPASTERLSEWAVDQWPAAQSLFLDLRAVADLPGLPGRAGVGGPARSALLRRRWTLPDLRCLHIIGYGERAPGSEARTTEGSGRQTRGPNERGGEGARSRRLAMERAADALTLLLGTLTLPALRVLSLDAALLRPLPHALAGLRHLALRMADDAPGGERDKHSGLLMQSPAMFEAVTGSLPALQTLYAEAASFCIIDYAHVIDLTPCKHLRAFTLVNVYAKATVTVPEGCFWTVVLPADSGELDWFSPTTWPGVVACHMRGFRTAGVSMAPGQPLRCPAPLVMRRECCCAARARRAAHCAGRGQLPARVRGL